jgi:shikimate dehydrogenase
VSTLPGRLVLLGHPVAHSASPRFQNAALRSAGIPLRYETLDVTLGELDAALAALALVNAAGNVTIPHKETVAARCAKLTPVAERCGAVNVFWHQDSVLHGDNTDVAGVSVVATALLQGQRENARVALLGAGGAAAAVLCALEGWDGAHVRLYNRHMPRAESLARRFSAITSVAATLEEALRDATLVVNATPVGLHDERHPVAIGAIPTGAAVFDLVYRPEETSWVREAREAGHRAADGEGMLLEQGALAFERWFGRPPDRGAMWRAMH